MKKRVAIVFLLCLLMLTGCCLSHVWMAATCSSAQTCTKCGKTQGNPLGHSWQEATCDSPKVCIQCGKIEGSPLEHAWEEATCTTPKTCAFCDSTEGEAIGHKWEVATCLAPKRCSVCYATDGPTVEHNWKLATCAAPKTCLVCGKVVGSALPHKDGYWKLTQEATVSKPAILTRNCEVCNTETARREIYMKQASGVSKKVKKGTFTFTADEFISDLMYLLSDKYVLLQSEKDGKPRFLLYKIDSSVSGDTPASEMLQAGFMLYDANLSYIDASKNGEAKVHGVVAEVLPEATLENDILYAMAGVCDPSLSFDAFNVIYTGMARYSECDVDWHGLTYSFLDKGDRALLQIYPTVESESESKSASKANPQIEAGNYHSVRLYSDGTVFAVGEDKLSTEHANAGTRLDVSSWTDIVAISASSHTVGLKADGTVVACGINRYGQCDLAGWSNIIAIAAGDNHTVGLRSDGTVVAQGKNTHGQCDVSHWRNIVAIAASENETYGLKEDGTIIFAGRYTYGSSWKGIVDICAGRYDLFGLKSNGTVVSAGSNAKDWSNNTIDSWSNISQLSASSTHVVGVRANGTVVACGKDGAEEACAVDKWRDIIQASAGMYFTIGLKSDGTVVSTGVNTAGQRNLN